MKNKGVVWASVALVLVSVLLIGVATWTYYEKNNKEDVVAGSNSEITEITEDTELLEEIGTETSTQEESEIVETEPIEPELEKKKIRLMMIGDNLMHLSVVNSGNQPDGTRDYAKFFEPIKEYLAIADIKITNQETIFGGNHLGFSGYPLFNSPTEMGDSMVKAGFNVVLHGTNHAADMGIAGIYNCLNFWEKYPDMLVMGIYKEPDVENQDIGLLTIDGVTFAILNYTYSPNMSSLPKDIQGHLGMLCDWDKNTGYINMKKLHPDVITDIQKAKQMADFVIVCPHWGVEYTFVPTEYQELFAQQMTAAGADLIVGTHPHVIQPVDWIEAENGNKALCFYSLGNYCSTQYESKTMLEAMAWVTFEVEEDSVKIKEDETGAIPMVYQYGTDNRFIDLYFLDEYTSELAQSHGINWRGGVGFTLENLQSWANEVLGEWRLNSEDVLKEKIDYELWR